MTLRKERPNILIFMTDQQQAQVTMPDHPCRTPRLDRFAEEGVRFTRAYPPMAHCCPSRASFMTGLYPSAHGVHNNVLNGMAIGKGLQPGVETFSEKLRASGYDLYYAGKWHVSAEENPADRGWTELCVSLGKGDAEPGVKARKPQPKQQAEPAAGNPYVAAALEQDPPRASGEVRRPGWRPYKLFTTEEYDHTGHYDYPKIRSAREQLEQLAGQEEPWCLFVGTGAPHDPFRGPRKYVEEYRARGIELPPSYHDDLSDKPAVYRKMRKVWESLGEEEVKDSIAHYWAYCTLVDDLFGEILDTLDATDQAEDTLVIFLSDHGELGGAHGLYLKGIPHFDEGYRIPCIMRWPKGIADPGRQIDEFVSIMDIAPTLLELAKAEPLKASHGRSLAPFFQDDNTPEAWREEMYTQCNGVELYYTQRSLFNKQFKFVYNAADIDELYDLEKDPLEMHNVIDQEDMQPVRRRMVAAMWEAARQTGDPIFTQYPSVALAELGPDTHPNG